MVGNIICVTDADKSAHMNGSIDTFIESKRLKLSDKKCHQIHIGKGHQNCPQLKVHENNKIKADKEKCLGDILDKSGSIQPTVENRKSKGQGINTGILAILNEIPFGKHKMDVAMKLGEVMLLNGILYNSEAWHGVTKNHIKMLEAIDEDLLRKLLKSQSKKPKELLYLETGAVSIKWIIAQRRIIFLKCILEKESNELVSKVFQAQKEKPTSGDFVKLVEQDMSALNVTYEDVKKMLKLDLKKVLKISARNACFEDLKKY